MAPGGDEILSIALASSAETKTRRIAVMKDNRANDVNSKKQACMLQLIDRIVEDGGAKKRKERGE